MNTRKTLLATATVAVLVTVGSANAQFAVDWYTVDGGGYMASSGGNYAVSGTIGQPDAGVMAGGNYKIAGGFWPGAIFGGCFANLDPADIADFTLCLAGPDNGVPNTACVCLDLDEDGDVDLKDFSFFQERLP